jgi:hypothetical protein
MASLINSSRGITSSSMLIRSFSISYLVLSPFKLRDKNPLIDIDKLSSTYLAKVSSYPSNVKPAQK